MYEHFAPLFGSGPHDGVLALYAQWAHGNWGMVTTGNVQVAKDHLPLGRDMVVPDELNDATLAQYDAVLFLSTIGEGALPLTNSS